jgi:hypothetical protein
MCSFLRAFSTLATLGLLSAFLTACGGGGSGGGSTSSTSSGTTYVTAAAPGELVTYTVDTTALTYSYTITESQYGLTGTTGSGTLTSLGNNAYSLSGIANSRIVTLPNGFMMGAIRHDFGDGNGVKTYPVVGMTNPTSTLAGMTGTYNFISRGCITGSGCTTKYGTIRINNDATWNYCPSVNVASGSPACGATSMGSVSSLGSGKYALAVSGTTVGTVLAMTSGGQTVLMVDLKDTSTGGSSLGKGFIVASTQTAVNTTQTDGTWFAHGSSGYTAVFTTSGNAVHYSQVNGSAANTNATITLDNPWTGVAQSPSSTPVMLAGQGVYVNANTATGYIEVGLKTN